MTDGSRPGPGEVAIVDAGPMIVATVRLSGCPPDRALAAFTEPNVLRRWWSGELTANLVPGGQYSVWFPAVPARLAGRVIGHQPDSLLAFTWAWEGEEGHPPSTVAVRVAPAGAATLMTIEHGPHADDEAGRAARAEHWAGWEFFLPRLPGAVAGG
jgi:uncharacterized protein YndB with AHSA1/START domain